MKKTVVFGATDNPLRFAYKAANMLADFKYEVVPVGIKKGKVAGEEIMDLRQKPQIEGVDTITLYVGPHNQVEWYDYIINLKPKRIIFNPGTENDTLIEMAESAGIQAVEDCTLVMLRNGRY